MYLPDPNLLSVNTIDHDQYHQQRQLNRYHLLIVLWRVVAWLARLGRLGRGGRVGRLVTVMRVVRVVTVGVEEKMAKTTTTVEEGDWKEGKKSGVVLEWYCCCCCYCCSGCLLHRRRHTILLQCFGTILLLGYDGHWSQFQNVSCTLETYKLEHHWVHALCFGNHDWLLLNV
jgi:hypothetical protein